METIDFSYNWNNKLGCLAFSTLRRHNFNKYRVGETYAILLKKATQFEAKIMAIKTIPLSKINEFIAYLDTGYSLEETLKVIHRMYPDANASTLFDLILLVRKK